MSEIIENKVNDIITRTKTITGPYVNYVYYLKNCRNTVFNMTLDLAKIVGQFTGVHCMGLTENCIINLKSKNAWYTDISVYDANADLTVNLDTQDNGGHDTSCPVYLGGNNDRIHLKGPRIGGFTMNNAIYSNARSVTVDDLTIDDAIVGLDARSGSHMVANNVTMLKAHWRAGRYGSRGFGAWVNMNNGAEPASLDIRNSRFYQIDGPGVELQRGTLKYTNLTVQAKDIPILNHPTNGGIIDPTSSGLTVIPWNGTPIPGYVNYRTVSNLGVQLNGAVSVDGVLKGNAPLNNVETPLGDHTASFGVLQGYSAPANIPFAIASGQTPTITGTYVGGIPPMPTSLFPFAFPAGLLAIAIGVPSGRKKTGSKRKR